MAYILILPLIFSVLTVKVFKCFISTKRQSYLTPVWCLKKMTSTYFNAIDSAF